MKLLQANEENTLRASGEREQGKARDWAVVNNVTEKSVLNHLNRMQTYNFSTCLV